VWQVRAQFATEGDAPIRGGFLEFAGSRLRDSIEGWEAMTVQGDVLRVLDDVLSLGGRSTSFTAATPLLGAIPELDSMAVVTLITTLEERLGIVVDDDDIDGDTFASVGSLVAFVQAKLDG